MEKPMKFYYNNKLIRTSKNHFYKFAVINNLTGKCIGCRADLKDAEAIISTEISSNERGIRNAQNAIKALQEGKSGYYEEYGRKKSWCGFSSCPSKFRKIETYEKWIEYNKNFIEYVKENWQIVELEAREK